MFLSDDPLGDRFDMLQVVWTINDVERAQEALLSSPHFQSIPFDMEHFSDGETPPPKAAFLLLDRPMPNQSADLGWEVLPVLLGQGLLFGRQTDREARLELMGIAGDDLPQITDLIRDALADTVQPEPKTEAVGRWSASQKLLGQLRMPPRDTPPDQLHALLDEQRRDAVLNHWPDLPLGVLDGRSVRAVIADPSFRVRILAAILVIEYWWPRHAEPFDFNELRAKLGLPELGPIDPAQQPVEGLPMQRLARLNVDGLSDKQLVAAYYRAGAYAIHGALRSFRRLLPRDLRWPTRTSVCMHTRRWLVRSQTFRGRSSTSIAAVAPPRRRSSRAPRGT